MNGAKDRDFLRPMDDTAKRGSTQFQDVLTLIPCAPKDFER